MAALGAIVGFLAPYEFSPTVAVCCLLAVAGFGLGQWRLRRRRQAIGWGRATAFLLGVVLIYAALQTHFDYWAQHMFYIHRIQHLVLHHLGPFLIAVAAPGPALIAAMPRAVRDHGVLQNRLLRGLYDAIQQPFVAAVLFVGLIYLWLIPVVHFYAMLNVPLYNAMNWSMAIDGVLFWCRMLDRRQPSKSGALAYGTRIALLAAVIFPQIAIGAYITLIHYDLYPVYAVCGRLWPISPVTDQLLGGLITWIPPAMMSVAGVLVVLYQWMQAENPRHASTVRIVPSTTTDPTTAHGPTPSYRHQV